MPLKRGLVDPAERRNRVMVGMQVGRHEAHGNVAEGRPLDPPRREDAVGIAVDQQRQHQPGMVLRLAACTPRHVECAERHPIDSRHYKMRQIVLRQPRLQVRRQKKRLVTAERNEGGHPSILAIRPKTGYPQSDSLLERPEVARAGSDRRCRHGSEDTRKHRADLPKNREGPTRSVLGPISSTASVRNGIKHRLSKRYHPWPPTKLSG